MISEQDVETAIRNAIACEHVEVRDTSNGCGTNFEVIIVSQVFEGKNTLLRHRLVNEHLKDQIAQMHAFTQKTFTPLKWAEEKEKLKTNAPTSS